MKSKREITEKIKKVKSIPRPGIRRNCVFNHLRAIADKCKIPNQIRLLEWVLNKEGKKRSKEEIIERISKLRFEAKSHKLKNIPILVSALSIGEMVHEDVKLLKWCMERREIYGGRK